MHFFLIIGSYTLALNLRKQKSNAINHHTPSLLMIQMKQVYVSILIHTRQLCINL
jgi:hypothetical protein